MFFPYISALGKVELHSYLKGKGREFHYGVLTDIEPKVNALVDGKACDKAVLVVNMGT